MRLFGGKSEAQQAEEARQQREAEEYAANEPRRVANQYIDEVVKPRWNAAWTMWLEAVSNARGDASSLTDEIMAQVGPPPPVFEPSEREKIHHRMAARGHAASIKGFVHGYLRGRGATDSFWRSVDDYCAAYYNNY